MPRAARLSSVTLRSKGDRGKVHSGLRRLSREVKLSLSQLVEPDHGWTYGLLCCFGDYVACLYGCFCPLCAGAEIYEKSGRGEWASGFHTSCCCAPCWACRGTLPLRRVKDIDSSLAMDCFLNICCCPCQRVRELREVREYIESVVTSQASTPKRSKHYAADIENEKEDQKENNNPPQSEHEDGAEIVIR